MKVWIAATRITVGLWILELALVLIPWASWPELNIPFPFDEMLFICVAWANVVSLVNIVVVWAGAVFALRLGDRYTKKA